MKPMRALLAAAAMCGAAVASAQSAPATSNDPTATMSATKPGSPGTVPAQSQLVGQSDSPQAAARAAADGNANRGVVTTAAQALKAKDDIAVVVEGTIVRKIRGEKYEFRDNTGTVTAEIDDDKWPNGQPIIGARVRLHGEVEKAFLSGKIEIDVDRVEPL